MTRCDIFHVSTELMQITAPQYSECYFSVNQLQKLKSKAFATPCIKHLTNLIQQTEMMD